MRKKPIGMDRCVVDTVLMNVPGCLYTTPFKPAPDAPPHRCRKIMGHHGRHRCGCLGGKCRVSWKGNHLGLLSSEEGQ